MISTDKKTEKRYVVAYKSDQHTNFVILVYDKNQREYERGMGICPIAKTK